MLCLWHTWHAESASSSSSSSKRAIFVRGKSAALPRSAGALCALYGAHSARKLCVRRARDEEVLRNAVDMKFERTANGAAHIRGVRNKYKCADDERYAQYYTHVLSSTCVYVVYASGERRTSDIIICGHAQGRCCFFVSVCLLRGGKRQKRRRPLACC